MYSGDGTVLSASTIAAPTVFGIVLWPNLAIYILGIAFVAIGVLFLIFKRKNRA